jgi:AmiR/NasT family two-component response regulator
VNHIQTVNGQLENALSSRIPIEQAKGFIAARLRTSPELAFDLLRARARSRREPLTQVARAVVASQIDIV